MSKTYQLAKEFKERHPSTVAWRLKANSKIIDKHLNPGEEVLYAFAGQKNNNPLNILGTGVIALTNKRILIGRNRVVFGYFFDSITPDMFNDLKIKSGVIWGKVLIDTMKEFIVISNVAKSALAEIETKVSTFIMAEKCKYTNSGVKKG